MLFGPHPTHVDPTLSNPTLCDILKQALR
jgi:hypothetical protein